MSTTSRRFAAMAMDGFTAYYAPLLDGAYSCVDRIVVNAYDPLGQTAGGFRTWWRWFQADDELTTKRLLRLAARFSRSARAWAREHGVPVIFCRKGEKKHKIAEQHLPNDPDYRGVFLVLVSKEPGPVWEVGTFPSGAIDLRPRQPWPYVHYYYFHLIDPDWGHVAIGVCCHPPFRARILLNEHEWLARQATRRGLEYQKIDNCFVAVPEPRALTALAATLDDRHIRAVCERWIYGLCFGLSVAEQRLSNFGYAYSVAQFEYSYNLLFTAARPMADLYHRIIDQTRRTLTPRTIRTIFGRTRTYYRHHIEVRIEAFEHDVMVVKVRFGTLTLKMYNKNGRVLRIECISANTSLLGVGRSVERFPRMVAALRAYVVAFLNQLQAADQAFLDYGTLETLRQSTVRGSRRRIPGLDIDKPRRRALLQGVTTLAPAVEGFTNADFRGAVQSAFPMQTAYTPRAASYDLAKLVAKDIIARVPRTRRYVLTPMGVRTAVGLLTLRSRLLEPVLSGIRIHPKVGRPKRISRLDQRYLTLQQALEEVCIEIGIAAA